MTDAQAWTLILGSMTATFATLGIVTTSLTRVMRAEFSAVRSEFRAEFSSVRSEFRSEFGSVRSEMDGLRTEMRAGFQRVDERIDHLDRDVQALMRHRFDHPE